VSTQQQQGIGCFGLIVIVLVIGWIANSVGIGGGSDDSSDRSVSSATPWRVSLLEERSYCDPSPLDAQIRFVVWVHNRDTVAREINLLPVRYYNDGGVNDSVLDLITATIEPRSRQFVDQTFSYKALEHVVIRCAVKFDSGVGLGSEVPIRVSD
jgi:hypothetical protein